MIDGYGGVWSRRLCVLVSLMPNPPSPRLLFISSYHAGQIISKVAVFVSGSLLVFSAQMGRIETTIKKNKQGVLGGLDSVSKNEGRKKIPTHSTIAHFTVDSTFVHFSQQKDRVKCRLQSSIIWFQREIKSQHVILFLMDFIIIPQILQRLFSDKQINSHQ